VTLAYVGLGSNLGEPRAHVEQALKELARLPRSRLLRHSSLYRSAPVGYAEQPEFVNAVAAVETDLDAHALLRELQALEERHGRARSFPNAPRTLDLDLLLFGEERICDARLTVPHPQMHSRAFVLEPLAEIAPDARIPGHASIAACLAACAGQTVRRLPS
jgi:2-amino-4-hydroxy-6-hydroxymethyldihydropteridine diphosphokinase